MSIITHYLQSAISSASTTLTTTILLDTGILILLIYIALMIIRSIGQTLKLPPGPKGFPIVGILPLIKKEFHLMLFDYSKIFGKILSFKMGSETVVVLSDYKTIKKAFQTRDFVARPKSELSSLLGGYGEFEFQSPQPFNPPLSFLSSMRETKFNDPGFFFRQGSESSTTLSTKAKPTFRRS